MYYAKTMTNNIWHTSQLLLKTCQK